MINSAMKKWSENTILAFKSFQHLIINQKIVHQDREIYQPQKSIRFIKNFKEKSKISHETKGAEIY